MDMPHFSSVATAIGIVGSAWASGATASLSLMGIPAALSAPSTSATVWATLFHRGFAIMPKFAGTTAIAYLCAATDAYHRGGNWKGLVAGALLTVGVVPYTIAFMGPTNELLIEAAQGTGSVSQELVAQSIRRWGTLNLGRSLLPLAGTMAGLLELFTNLQSM